MNYLIFPALQSRYSPFYSSVNRGSGRLDNLTLPLISFQLNWPLHYPQTCQPQSCLKGHSLFSTPGTLFSLIPAWLTPSLPFFLSLFSPSPGDLPDHLIYYSTSSLDFPQSPKLLFIFLCLLYYFPPFSPLHIFKMLLLKFLSDCAMISDSLD